MGNRLATVRPDGMWKLVFYKRVGLRVEVDRSGPWLPSRATAESWARFFLGEGYHVGLLSQDGKVERLSPSLPG
jgi:hypothetical protein